jgi:hypothetical protein
MATSLTDKFVDMAELDSILKKYVNVDASAEGVLRAAAFVVKERTGEFVSTK